MIDEKGTHKEEIWVGKICELLKEEFNKDDDLKNKYYIATGYDLIHAVSLNNATKIDKNSLLLRPDNLRPNEYNIKKTDCIRLEKDNLLITNYSNWNVDLFIGQISKDDLGNELYIPRVVIEAKYVDVNTHDPITYNYKANLHKNLYPGLRYGIMIGNYDAEDKHDEIDIPTRLINYGDNFDFFFLFRKDTLDKKELNKLMEVIKENLNSAKEIEDFIENRKDKNKYWYIDKYINFDKDK